MVLSQKKLIGLAVKTKSGQALGQIKDFEMETETGNIIRFSVSPSQLVKKIFTEDIFISKSQVIEISEKEMIVEDNLVKSGALASEIA